MAMLSFSIFSSYLKDFKTNVIFTPTMGLFLSTLGKYYHLCLNHERQKNIFWKVFFWPYYLHSADNMASQNLPSKKICKFKYKCKELRHMNF
jgi:hypothetical protein